MYAIIRTGGKQYKVQPGDVVRVEKINEQLGSEFDLTEILAVGGENLLVGKPLVANAKVTVVVTKQAKTPKIIIFKKKRRQGYRRTQGHRQFFTELFIKSITSPDGKVVKSEAQPNVVDVAAVQMEKIKARTIPTKKEKIAGAVAGKPKAAKKAKATTGEAPVKKAKAKKVVKKVAKKAAPKKTAKTAKAKSKE